MKDLSLSIESGSTLCFIGTSGCGKTTTLKMINRLIEPTKGTIKIGGKDVMTRDPNELRRSIGYVIQKGGLFPHMTVGDNIRVVATLLSWAEDKAKKRCDELLELVSLPPDDYRDRYPHELSGGQQQRVGVARALMVDPPVILMDEPFGALDPITREGLQDEFIRLKNELKKTIVFVTHDLAEAFKLADQVAIMDAGVIQQAASGEELMKSPKNDFVEEFVRSHSPAAPPSNLELADVMDRAPQQLSPYAPRLSATESVATALDEMFETGVESIVVYDDDQRIVGAVTKSSLIGYFRRGDK